MSPPGAPAPLAQRRIGRAELDVLSALDLDPDQVVRFLDPVPHILAAVRRGAAHELIGLEAGGALAGFGVLHPDPRDAACWWLGWFALARAWQGRGHGRPALAGLLARLRRRPGCRRVRLLVAPDNAGARRLYARAGFRAVGRADAGDLILELALPATRPDGAAAAGALARPLRAQRRRRPPRPPGPHADRALGPVRGPPFTPVTAGAGWGSLRPPAAPPARGSGRGDGAWQGTEPRRAG